MRIVSAIDPALRDEHVLEVDPSLRPELPGEWRRRINPFTGRSLSDKALTAEQGYRGGIQRLRGQSLTAGAVFGLDLQLEPGAAAAFPSDARFQLLPGMGLSVYGEDVVVSTPRRLALGDLPVYARADYLDALTSGATSLPPDPSGPAQPTPGALAGGLFVNLRPELPRRIGASLTELLGQPAAADLPPAAILLAEPVTATILARPDATNCPHDPRDDPYDDLQLIDGCRLTLFLWPSEMVAISGRTDYSLPEAGPDFRNRLAYRVFDAERHALPGEVHPWERVGVPLALIGFKPDWTLDFIDRGAVCRLGGQPRPRTPLAPTAGQGLLWQARLAQFVEQYGELADQSPAALAATFRELPPIGFLPRSVINLDTRRQSFFPPGFEISAAPIPTEHVDAAVRDSASLIPISLDAADEVELLVPVPERVYEPGLLEVATVDPAFTQAVARYTGDRTTWLIRREMVRRRRDLLVDGVTGCRPSWPASDLPLTETLPYPRDRAPVTCTQIRSIAAGTAAQSHRFVGAGSSLDISPGDRVYVWARIADATGLQGLMLRLGTGTAGDGSGDFSHEVFWGAQTSLPLPAGAGAAPLRQGDLPPAGVWTRLDAPAASVWTANGGTLVGVKVNAAEFWQAGGTVEWGPFGKVSAAGAETVYLGDNAPQDSTLQGPGGAAGWTFKPTGVTAAPIEDMYGTVEASGIETIAALTDFRAKWSQPFLAGHFVNFDEEGLDGFIADLQARVNATNDALDLGFVRARSDIYRVRSYVLGADAASRLVTSPTLADIAIRDEGARAKSADLAQFLTTAYETGAERDPNNPMLPAPPPAPVAAGAPPPAPPTPRRVFVARPTLYTTDMTLRTARTLQVSAPAVSAARFVAEPRPVVAAQPFFISPALTAAAAHPVTTTIAAPRVPAAIQAVSFGAYSITAIQAAHAGAIGIQDVQGQLALPGRVERTASVAERLTPAPAVEAHAYALEGKQTVIATLAGLIGEPAPGQARPPGLALGDLPAPGYNYTPTADPPAPRVKNTVADVIQDQLKVASAREYADTDDLAPAAARHEADYFNASVGAIDNTIALMRLVEARVDLYQQLITDACQLRSDLDTVVASVDARLRAINVQVEEARHDVATTSALLAEEVQRVNDLNAQRARILQDNVKVILFRRPRRADVGQQIQTAPAPSALVENALTACLREHPETPEEIRDFASLLRDAPVMWFPPVAQQLILIDRLEAARTLIAAIQVRASFPAIAPPAPPLGTLTKLLGSVWAAIAAEQAILERRRITALQMDANLAATVALAEARQVINDHASMADLIAGDHNRPALAVAAAQELQQIGQVAGCLYAAFCETPPVIRLAWAEVLSEFTQPTALAQLSGLPRWNEVDAQLKRAQQSLVDWLFSRVDHTTADAENAINELVRVCLLMSAHAPVDRIVTAQTVAPSKAQLGSRFDLAVDVTQTRIGMTATVRDETGHPLAQAVVEDLTDGLARARVVKSFQPTASVARGHRVELDGKRRLK